MKRAFAVWVWLLLVAPSATLWADGGDEVYAYLGPDYTNLDNFNEPGPCFVCAPYTTTDFVSGLFTTSSPLAPNLVMQPISPLSYSFSDGFFDYNSTGPAYFKKIFEVSTDQYGTVIDAYIVLSKSYNYSAVLRRIWV